MTHLTIGTTFGPTITWIVFVFEVTMAVMFGRLAIRGFWRRRKHRDLVQLRKQLRKRLRHLPLDHVLFCEQQNTSVLIEKKRLWPIGAYRLRVETPLEAEEIWCPVHDISTYRTSKTYTLWGVSEAILADSNTWDGEGPKKKPSILTFFKEGQKGQLWATKKELEELMALLDIAQPFQHP